MNLYELYVDGDKFYDIRINDLALIDPVLELKTNNAGTLTFTVPPKHPKFDSFKPLTSTIEIYRDGEWFWEGRIIDVKGDFYNRQSYTVEGALGYLNDSIQPQWEVHDATPISYVEQLLNVHNSMVADNRKIYLGAITVTDPNNSMYRFTNFNSTLKELKEDMIDDLGGIIKIRKTNGQLYLDILDEPDRICSQEIRLGQNLIDLMPENDYMDIASVIIPLGATLEDQEEHEEGLEALDKYVTIEEVNDGKNYLARSDLINEYDRIWQVVQFSNIHTPQGLYEKAQEYLKDGQWGEMVIETKAFDLNYTDEEFQEFRLNDRVRVISEYHGIDRYFPLTAQTIHFNDPSQNTITLGGTGESVTMTGITNQVTINTEKLTERVKDPNRLIEQAIYEATQLITQGLNGYVRVDGNEILIMDTDDPATAKHVWRWNMGGLGYSNNGYNGPFETAITMDGTIVGKFLAANSVVAEQIDVNYRSHVEQQISQAESDANDYTDGKLGDYWTYKETETYFKTLADSIEAGVKSTLTGYYTKEQVEAQLKITEGNIVSSVTDSFEATLEDYSTTRQVQSLIDQKADSITSSVTQTFNTKLGNYYTSGQVDSKIQQSANSITSSVNSTITEKLGDYSTTSQVKSLIKQSADSITTTLSKYVTDTEFSQLEQKVTADGIFTTINNGIAGSKSINNTYFTMDRTGLEIQNGGIVVKNRSGTEVLSVNTSGDLEMRGNFYHYGNRGYKAVDIYDHKINIYAYNQTGNFLGSLGATVVRGSSTPNICLWSDYGDNLILGTVQSPGSSTIQGIIELGSYGGTAEIKGIQGTTSGTFYVGNAYITVKNGLITAINGTYGQSGNVDFADIRYRMTFTRGVLTGTGNY